MRTVVKDSVATDVDTDYVAASLRIIQLLFSKACMTSVSLPYQKI